MKRSKRVLCLLLCAVLLTPSALAAPAVPEVTAPCMVLMEAATGTVLAEKNAHEARPPASVTKIMTLLLTMEALERGVLTPDTPVTVGPAAREKGGSQIYLEDGEVMRAEDLIKSVIIASANDAACALAEHLAGSEGAFVDRMNQRAAELGMADTHFVNCTGLDAEGHVTSAHDIAVMSRELLRYEMVRKYTTVWMDTVRDGAFGLTNTNKLIRLYPGTTGLKTGYTSVAGYCISAAAQRDGMELICAILGEATSDARSATAKAMLDWGFASYTLCSAGAETVLLPVPVTLGRLGEVQPILSDTAPLLLERGEAGSVTRTVTVAERLEAPVAEGQVLGTLTLTGSTGILREIPITAGHGVERLTVSDLFWELLGTALGCRV